MKAAQFGKNIIACVLAFSLALFCPLSSPEEAFADPLSEALASLDAAEAQMSVISAEYDELLAEVEELQAQIDETAAAAMSAQEAVISGREQLARTAEYNYREGMTGSMLDLVLESGDFSDLLRNIEYVSQIMEYQADEVLAQKERKAELDQISVRLDEQKTAQEAALRELETKRTEAEQLAGDAAQKLAEVQASEEVRLKALQQTAQQMYRESAEGDISGNANTTNRQDAVPNGTPVAPPNSGDAGSAASGWYTGIASAYGGSSDPYTPNPGTTATGAVCDDWSMGVAVPMSMPRYRSYFGRTVEIRYGGMTVYAVVNDCGKMGNGSRVLDLQPGVFKAFGFSDCYAWGLRTVSYRFL